jgi:hypothetical protein
MDSPIIERVVAFVCFSGLNSGRSIKFNTLATRALRLLVTLHSALPLFFGAFADVFFVRIGGSGEQGSRGKVACYVRLSK